MTKKILNLTLTRTLTLTTSPNLKSNSDERIEFVENINKKQSFEKKFQKLNDGNLPQLLSDLSCMNHIRAISLLSVQDFRNPF
jgi:hypothetical protein